MNRREALKKLGLSFGFLVGAPTAVSILQGCSNSGSTAGATAMFFTDVEKDIITKIVDIILPATADTPSASEVNVPEFIDQYVNEVVSIEEQDRTKEYLGKFIEQLSADNDSSDVSSLTEDDIRPYVAESLEKSPEEEQRIYEEINNYTQAKQNGESIELFDEVANFALLTNLRSMAIWSYKTSQTVGEEILAYEPIPGRQEGCVDLEEATGGRAWSL
ncbi:gluconate 2-dehydrogenase subunit 3 family protein [Balneolaceae bacterium YR4-1]|uniref:Gluconate 2-dehydrogenase subunit 3 family protein n=1 Tax=Halalkalibaculum roseum TaxID=2709311 RepID=A0A6M1T1I4_9BACT|nr:gluconate 2-dehydrogenase subunit 3 family protein [Halalkalibaculum roseum]NGP76607.1 gluconate 2-dehydrogenase subunit 3 family protein [Halalkalibaculum roseum]